MAVRYIYNTSGDYVAFISDGYLFNPHGKWLGFVTNGNEVYNVDGFHVGHLLDDDRIVRDSRVLISKRSPRPTTPLTPLTPLRPLRRLKMFSVPFPYVDIFEGVKENITKLVPLKQIKEFDYLLGSSLYANDDTFLGKISKDVYANDSILNKYGKYGSPYEQTSIFNQYGKYGGQYSQMSPFNPYTTIPPKIIRDKKFIGYLSINESLVNRIDTNELCIWLGL